ncbi:MAG: AbrB family transcriptional regulator [Acidaminococcaceae bacterium]|nr:AbrB family transcriptional regulator [Acidaminococcaceae bacterium]
MNRILALVVAFIIGYALNNINMPIPWMLGGIFAALLGKISGKYQVSWPRAWRNYGLVVVGYGIGRYVTPQVVSEALRQIPGIVGATLVAVLIAVAISVFMYKYNGVDLQSVIMGIMPGGFTQMTAMSDEDARVDQNIVAVLQSLRLITIIVMVPLLVKQLLHAQVQNTAISLTVADGVSFWYFLPFCYIMGIFMEKIKSATPYLMGPIILAAAGAVYFGQINTAPAALMALAQLSIGIYVGSGLDPVRLRSLRQLLPATFAGIFAMLFASIGVAYLLSDVYSFSLVTSFLAMAPGGLGEMCLVGMSLGENVAIILTYQMFRFLFLNLAVPFGIARYFGPAIPRE